MKYKIQNKIKLNRNEDYIKYIKWDKINNNNHNINVNKGKINMNVN